MKKFIFAASLMLAISAFLTPASAQTETPDNTVTIPQGGLFDVSIPEPEAGNNDTPFSETHPILRLTPEKSELVRLNKNAVSVIVGNPDHLSVLLDTPRVVVLIPRAPGATHFTILDREGEVVMQRHVIVASPKQQYVRVRRSCINAGEDSACNATSVYFCPDMCHEISVTQLGGDEEESDGGIPAETPLGPSPESNDEQ